MSKCLTRPSLIRLVALIATVPFLGGCSLQELGRNIPQTDIETDYMKGCLWAFFLAATIAAWPARRPDKVAILVAWVAKIVVTLGAMLFYEWYYGLDAYSYFDVPRYHSYFWEGFEFGNGTQNMLQLSWLQQQVIPDSYHALKVSCAFIGLIAIYLIYRGIILYLQTERLSIFYGLALFPSILFWSSILGKDPVELLGIGLYVYGVLAWNRTNRFRYVAIVAIGVLIAMLIRIWMGPILILPLAVFLWTRVRSLASKVVFVAGCAALFAWGLAGVAERFNVETSADVYATTTSISQGWAIGGSAQALDQKFTSSATMLTFMPLGIVTALFRPFPGEIMNVFGILAGLENLLLIYLTWMAFRRARISDFRDPVVSWATLVVLIWAAVYGFVSYQNLGSAVRFRLQVLPILLALALYLGRVRAKQRPTAGLKARPQPLRRTGLQLHQYLKRRMLGQNTGR